MQKLRNRYFILIFILCFTVVLIRFLGHSTDTRSKTSVKIVEQIPRSLGSWQGEDVPLAERVYEILESRSIVHRKYYRNGGSVFLSIVYYPETKVDFHTPEHCLAGQGIEISKTGKRIEIQSGGETITINLYQLVRKYDQYNEVIYYFYKSGDFIGPSYIQLRFALLMNKFFSSEKSGALIRVTTPISIAGMQVAEKRLEDFIAALYPYLIQYL